MAVSIRIFSVAGLHMRLPCPASLSGYCMLQEARSFCDRKGRKLMQILLGLLCKPLRRHWNDRTSVVFCDRTGFSPHSLNRLATPTLHFPNRAVRCCLDNRNFSMCLVLGERANRWSPRASWSCEFLADGILEDSDIGCSNQMGYTYPARYRQRKKRGQADEMTRSAANGAPPRESVSLMHNVG
jgi:hypothetical protein